MDDERTKARILRCIVAAAMGLALIAFVLALVPSVEVWHDTGPNTGMRRVEARSVVEHPAWMLLWGLFVVGPAAIVWFRPRLTFACLWSMIAFGATAMWFVATADMPARNWSPYVHFIDRWPARLFDLIWVLLVGAIVVALPVFCGAFAFVTGRRDSLSSNRATLPAARVLRRRS